MVHTEFRYCSDRWAVEHIGGVEEAVLLVSSQCRTICEALLPAAESFADEEIDALTSSIVDGSKSYELCHSRAIASHRRPIHCLNDLGERFGERFLCDRRAVDLDTFRTGQKMRSCERADPHRHA